MNIDAMRQFDALEVVRLGQTTAGRFSVNELKRLLEGLPQEQLGQVNWAVQGQPDAFERKLLDLEVSASVQMICQRCLQPVEQAVHSRVLLQLVPTEAELEEANEADAESDPATEDTLDVEPVLCRGRLDLFAEIEDELILALPYIALHEVCPVPLPKSAGDAIAEPPHPFAELARLREQPNQGGDDSSADETQHDEPSSRSGKSPGKSGGRSR